VWREVESDLSVLPGVDSAYDATLALQDELAARRRSRAAGSSAPGITKRPFSGEGRPLRHAPAPGPPFPRGPGRAAAELAVADGGERAGGPAPARGTGPARERGQDRRGSSGVLASIQAGLQQGVGVLGQALARGTLVAVQGLRPALRLMQAQPL